MTCQIVLFLYEDFQLLDAAGPIAAFEIASRLVQRPDEPAAYAIHLTGKATGLARSSSGVPLPVEALDNEAPIDTFIVVGGDGSQRAILDHDLLDQVRAADIRARRLASVCSGAFVLAEAGLLDGLGATTHWRRAAAFARRYPRVRVQTDRIYIRQGRVWTSAGISAGIDLSLALIAEDLGEALAQDVAREMVVYHRRSGGQSQFSALLELAGQEHRFSSLLDQVRQNLAQRWSVEHLAEVSCMSPRHFSRAFTEATGMSPAKAVERLRIEAARGSVEAGIDPIEDIAAKAGFGDPERMRRAFVQTFGLPPQSLRRQARRS